MGHLYLIKCVLLSSPASSMPRVFSLFHTMCSLIVSSACIPWVISVSYNVYSYRLQRLHTIGNLCIIPCVLLSSPALVYHGLSLYHTMCSPIVSSVLHTMGTRTRDSRGKRRPGPSLSPGSRPDRRGQDVEPEERLGGGQICTSITVEISFYF